MVAGLALAGLEEIIAELVTFQMLGSWLLAFNKSSLEATDVQGN